MYCSGSRTASALGLVRDRDMRADAFGDKKHGDDHHTTRANVSSNETRNNQQPHAADTHRTMPLQASTRFCMLYC